MIGRPDLAAQVQARAVRLASPGERAAYKRVLSFYERCGEFHKQATAERK